MSSGFGRSLITLVVSFALGCSSSSDAGGGDPPTPEPVASVTVTSAQSSVVVGASVQMSVTTLDASGNPYRTHRGLEHVRRGGSLAQHQRERDGGVHR